MKRSSNDVASQSTGAESNPHLYQLDGEDGKRAVSDGVDTDLPDDFELLVVGPSDLGGIYKYIVQQMNYLERTVDISFYDSKTPSLGTGGIHRLKGVVRGIAAFSRFPMVSHPDLVHVHTSHRFSFYRKSLYVFVAKNVWDVPIVLHIHGSSFDEFMMTDSQAVATLQRMVFSACDEIIVLSEYWRDVVSLRADESKIRVVPNAVDPSTFPADPKDETPHIVFVSNLIERKGVEELAAAVEELSRRYPDRFRVSIAGDGPRSDRVERLAEANDEVTYQGFVSEKHKRTLLRDGSIYVLPTYAEGLPIAMLEGMAGANAVVTTSVGGIPDVIDEDNGILVEPGNVDALVDALERLITSPDERAAMAETNRRIIEERYSWHRATEELIEIYESQC